MSKEYTNERIFEIKKKFNQKETRRIIQEIDETVGDQRPDLNKLLQFWNVYKYQRFQLQVQIFIFCLLIIIGSVFMISSNEWMKNCICNNLIFMVGLIIFLFPIILFWYRKLRIPYFVNLAKSLLIVFPVIDLDLNPSQKIQILNEIEVKVLQKEKKE